METASAPQRPSLVRVAVGILAGIMFLPLGLLLAGLPAMGLAMSVREIDVKWWEQLLYWVWLAVVLGVSVGTLRSLHRWVRKGTPSPKRQVEAPSTWTKRFDDGFD